MLGDTKTKNDMHEKQVKLNLDITISGTRTSVKYIGGGNGIDTITAEKVLMLDLSKQTRATIP